VFPQFLFQSYFEVKPKIFSILEIRLTGRTFYYSLGEGISFLGFPLKGNMALPSVASPGIKRLKNEQGNS
jgi:hypothetical protein